MPLEHPSAVAPAFNFTPPFPSRVPLQTEAAEAAGKPMVLINPSLGDVQSSSGVMGVRGRQGRMDFAATYVEAYHFRLLYRGAMMYPIMGALRHSYGGGWEVRPRAAPGDACMTAGIGPSGWGWEWLVA